MGERLDVQRQLLPSCEIKVLGRPIPRGSTKAVTNKHTGRAMIVDQSSESLKTWMQDVRGNALNEWIKVRSRYTDGPFKIKILFVLNRPKNHYGTGRNSDTIKPSSPTYPIVRPDIDKLSRAILDALTKVVYQDDSQVIELHVRKVYGWPEGVTIKIYEL